MARTRTPTKEPRFNPQLIVDARLLGEFEWRCDGKPMAPLASARATSLVGYLLFHHQSPVRRERLAFALWPDSSEPQARTNLRHLIHELRRVVPAFDDLVDVGPRSLQWRVE